MDLKIGILAMLVGIAMLGMVITDVSATHTSMCQSGGSCHSAWYCGGGAGFECCYTYAYPDEYGWHYYTSCNCC